MNKTNSINHLNDAVLRSAVAAHGAIVASRTNLDTALAARTREDERGEGVISVALAVLIMAALAAAMWLAYKAMWDDASERTSTLVKKVGGA